MVDAVGDGAANRRCQLNEVPKTPLSDPADSYVTSIPCRKELTRSNLICKNILPIFSLCVQDLKIFSPDFIVVVWSFVWCSQWTIKRDIAPVGRTQETVCFVDVRSGFLNMNVVALLAGHQHRKRNNVLRFWEAGLATARTIAHFLVLSCLGHFPS